MTVTREEWKNKLDIFEFNRIARRKQRDESNKPIKDKKHPYQKFISKIYIGETLLDVGCGNTNLRKVLPKSVQYTGIDPLPIVDGVTNVMIEEYKAPDKSFCTVVCLAALDHVMDLKVALKQMNRIAKKNIIILTSIDAKPNDDHTHLVSEKDLRKGLYDFRLKRRIRFNDGAFVYDFHRKDTGK